MDVFLWVLFVLVFLDDRSITFRCPVTGAEVVIGPRVK